MGEMYGIGLEYILAGVAAIVLVVVSALVVRARRQKQLAEDAKPKLTRGARPESPTRDVLSDRRTISAPVEIDDSMSLKEVRELKRARLDRDYKESDSSQKAKEWRQGAQDSSQTKGSAASSTPRIEQTLRSDEAGKPREDASPLARSSAGSRRARDEVAASPKEAPEIVVSPEVVSGQPEAVSGSAANSKPTKATRASEVDEEETPKSLEDGLAKTRTGFLGRIGSIFSGRTELNEALLEEVEEVLFTADIGARVSQQLLMAIETRVSSLDSHDPEIVWAVLREEVESILDANDGKFEYDPTADPFVVLVVGVNGAGKTTTIGKLAARYQREGKKVLMVAGDTFRAAAVEQLEAWADRVGCGFHRGESEADPSSVIYDGIEHAKSEGFDLVLCDTAGRLHTRAPLVDELKKIHRVCGKAHDGAPHETLLVLDANTGQNAIQQAKLFGEAVDVTGIVLTKLDGTAKGGVILGICKDLGVPVHFIGIGEGVRDLRPFDGREFVEALFA